MCTMECHVCSGNCNIDDPIGKFARAGKETLIRRLDCHEIPEDKRQAVIVWLKVQFDYEYVEKD